MWTKEFLSEEQLAFYKLHPWYYAEFEKFSIRTSNIIELYKSREGYRKFLPPYVGISLTYKCNLTCKMCFQDDRSKYEHEMSTDKLIEIADEIKDWETFPWVTLWGGEPLLNKNFRTVYERFQEAAGVVTILTNGVLLHHYLDLISDASYKTVWVFSIDGTEDIHDEIRGKKGSFKKTMNNLRNAVQLRNSLETQNVFGVQITVTRQNLDSIKVLCQELVEIGVDWVVLNNLWFLTETESDLYLNQLTQYDYLQLSEDISSKGFVLERDLLPDPHKVHKIIEECKEMSKTGTLIWSMPNHDLDESVRHYNPTLRKGPNTMSCYKNLVKMDIDVDGSVVACKQFPDIIYGSVESQSIKDIWLSNLRFKMQDQIVESNGFSICNMCPDKALSVKYQ